MAVEKMVMGQLNELVGFNLDGIERDKVIDRWKREVVGFDGDPLVVVVAPFEMNSDELKLGCRWLGDGLVVVPRKMYKDGDGVVTLASGEADNGVVYPPSEGEEVRWPEMVNVADRLEGRGVVLVASLQDHNAVRNVVDAAEWLKNYGAPSIMVMASRLPSLRQDGLFLNNNEIVHEFPTALGVLKGIKAAKMPDGSDVVDALVGVELHSHLGLLYAGGLGLNMIGVTGYKWAAKHPGVARPVVNHGTIHKMVYMIVSAEDELERERLQAAFAYFLENDEARGFLYSLEEIDSSKIMVARPDENRHTTANKLADFLRADSIHFEKGRDTVTGEVIITNIEEVKRILEEKGITDLVIFDDEFQTGSTMKVILDCLPEGVKATIIAMHPNFTEKAKENLDHPAIKRVVVTDAMMPREVILNLNQPEDSQVMVLPMGDSLVSLARSLWKGELDNLPDGWELDPWLTS